MLKSTIANVHATTVEHAENAQIVDVQLSEELIASSEDLTTIWRYFRITDPIIRELYGLPVENSGREVQLAPVLSAAQEIQAVIVREWFRIFATGQEYSILRIETPLGGIFVRKTLPGECVHKFVTMDLPAEPSASLGVATFETLDCFM